jgi:hypothetical protein
MLRVHRCLHCLSEADLLQHRACVEEG